MSSWAHLVTVHALPGDGQLTALSDRAAGAERGALLVAEMSSKGCLVQPAYTAGGWRWDGGGGRWVVGAYWWVVGTGGLTGGW